jgi:hypothetical protein
MLRGSQLCSSTGSVTAIKFLLPIRQWHALEVIRSGLIRTPLFGVRAKGVNSHLDSKLRSSARTKEVAECSNRGSCDRALGVCNCLPGYTSSDGKGRAGLLGDCGHLTTFETIYGDGNSSFVSPCPVVGNLVCGGNGYCDPINGLCNCYGGFGERPPFLPLLFVLR